MKGGQLTMHKKTKTFVRHFRIYFKNNHPAYIVDEEGNMFVFHRATHSKTSGGRSNWPYDNPLLKGGNGKLYIVKKEQRDKKTKFSSFELELKPNVDISYPEIKKFGSLLQLEECATNTSDSGNHHTNCRSRYESSEHIKPKEKYKSKKNKRDS